MTVCGCCCAKDDDSVRPEDEVTYEAALLARYAHAGGAPGGAKGGRSHSISTSSVALAGVPTYRLPHHPRYSEIFSNPLYKPVWFKAFGRLRYTTLVSALSLSVRCPQLRMWLPESISDRLPELLVVDTGQVLQHQADTVTTVSLACPVANGKRVVTATYPPVLSCVAHAVVATGWRVHHRSRAHPRPRPIGHGAFSFISIFRSASTL